MNNNFKTSLVIASPHLRASLWPIAYESRYVTHPKLISECRPNSNFSTNLEDNKNDQDNENHPDNRNEGNYPANKYMFQVNNRKRFWCRFSYGYFTLCSGVFNVNFEHVIVHSVVIFHHKYEVFMFYMHWKSSYFFSKFYKECLLCIKIYLIDLKPSRFNSRFNSHLRLVQMTLKNQ